MLRRSGGGAPPALVCQPSIVRRGGAKGNCIDFETLWQSHGSGEKPRPVAGYRPTRVISLLIAQPPLYRAARSALFALQDKLSFIRFHCNDGHRFRLNCIVYLKHIKIVRIKQLLN